jgi:hypothetical protein
MVGRQLVTVEKRFCFWTQFEMSDWWMKTFHMSLFTSFEDVQNKQELILVFLLIPASKMFGWYSRIDFQLQNIQFQLERLDHWSTKFECWISGSTQWMIFSSCMDVTVSSQLWTKATRRLYYSWPQYRFMHGDLGRITVQCFWYIAGCGLAISIWFDPTSRAQELSFPSIYSKFLCLWGGWWGFHDPIEHLHPMICFETENSGQGAIQTELLESSSIQIIFLILTALDSTEMTRSVGSTLIIENMPCSTVALLRLFVSREN